MYYGEGFNHSDLYDMPVYLRNFYYRELVNIKEEESKEIKKSKSQSKAPNIPRAPKFKR